METTAEIKISLFKEMLRIRRIEEAIADNYPKNEMRCPIHLSIGQEAVPVGLSAHLTVADHVYSTHRCHAHYLAKGGCSSAMMAELYGKITGCAEGKGGSMHLIDVEKGMMGASALVGGTIPIAVGSALSFQFEKSDRVAICYFGDGGSEEGIFYESMNFAALKKLPVIFVIENNLYATYSHQDKRQATNTIYSRGETFGIPGEAVDGNNVLAIYHASQKAVLRARLGEGPSILECKTYRFRDHVGPSNDWNVGYRTEADVKTWIEKCPIEKIKTELTQKKILNEPLLNEIETSIQEEIEAAFAFAKSSPLPDKTELERHLYA